MRSILTALVWVGTLVGVAPGQDHVTAGTTGTVYGRVTFAEDKLPARYAEVRLIARPAALDATAEGAVQAATPIVRQVEGSTGIDGFFELRGVPAGVYLAVPRMNGYRIPGDWSGWGLNLSANSAKRLVETLATVRVRAGQVATLDLALERAATVSGRVTFADGAPGVGLGMGCEPVEVRNAKGRIEPMSAVESLILEVDMFVTGRQPTLTDEDGRYRLEGIPRGKCRIGTVLPEASGWTQMSGYSGGEITGPEPQPMYPQLARVLAPGVFRLQDATVFEIKGSERIEDADLRIDSGALHTLRGRVVVAGDRHAPANGLVYLLEQGAKGVERFGQTGVDGLFHFDLLPPGTYQVEVIANDRAMSDFGKPGSAAVYRLAKATVVVSEHDVQIEEIALTPLGPGEAEPTPDIS